MYFGENASIFLAQVLFVLFPLGRNFWLFPTRNQRLIYSSTLYYC